MKIEGVNMKEESKKIKRALDFTLTEQEYAERGKQAAELAKDVRDMKSEFDALKKQWKGNIDLRESQLDKILRVIKLGKETRIVECLEHKNFKENKVEYIVDGEVMEERAMDASERQVEMAFKKKAKANLENMGKQ